MAVKEVRVCICDLCGREEESWTLPTFWIEMNVTNGVKSKGVSLCDSCVDTVLEVKNAHCV